MDLGLQGHPILKKRDYLPGLESVSLLGDPRGVGEEFQVYEFNF